MTTTSDILHRHGVKPSAVLGSGMEADVYARDESTVLKLYRRPNVLRNLQTLQAFYELLDASSLPYALPHIIEIEDYGDVVASIERRFGGVPMAQYVPRFTASGLDVLIERYLGATLDLQQVGLRSPLGRHKLFDPLGVDANDWHDFLRRYLEHESARLAPSLRRDVRDWEVKRKRLIARLCEPYTAPSCVIHGDIFPGNFMMDGEWITGLLDFGMMTMVGDPLWDVATGIMFFDMYDELQLHARERCFEVVLDRLGSSILPILYLYVMLYSVMGADAYAPAGTDGHYRWCIENLNNADWWRAL